MKKRNHRLLPFLLVLLVVLGGASYLFTAKRGLVERVQSQGEFNALSSSDFQGDPQSGYARLTADEKNVYAMMIHASNDFNPHIELSGLGITVDSMDRVWHAFYQDNPEYFWINAYRYSYDPDSQYVASVDMTYTCTQEEKDAKQQKIDEKFEAIKKLVPAGADEYTIIKTVHDAIISQTTYGLSSADNQNIVSVMVDGESVCAGYSKAMQYVLKKLGVFCIIIDGQAIGYGPHEWNLVKMDGQYYYVDATWDDPAFADNGDTNQCVEYTFFGITTEELNRSHQIIDWLGGMAECTATQDNYFVREGRLFSGDDTAGFIAGLRNAIVSGSPDYSARFSSGSLDTAVHAMEVSNLTALATLSYIRHDDLGVITVLIN